MGLLKRWIENLAEEIAILKYKLSYENCYDSMEGKGLAVFGSCCGVVGGDKITDYTNESCLGCPYYTPIPCEESNNET